MTCFQCGLELEPEADFDALYDRHAIMNAHCPRLKYFRGRDYFRRFQEEMVDDRQFFINLRIRKFGAAQKKRSPFHFLAAWNCPDLIQQLCAPDATNYTPIHYASLNGNDVVLELLLKMGVNVETKGYGGKSALHCAAMNVHCATIKIILQNNAIVDALDNNDATPLMEAARRGHTKCIRLLLDENAKIDQADLDGDTALMLAAERNHLPVVKLLLDRNADVNLENFCDGKNALSVAVEENNLEVIKYMCNKFPS